MSFEGAIGGPFPAVDATENDDGRLDKRIAILEAIARRDRAAVGKLAPGSPWETLLDAFDEINGQPGAPIDPDNGIDEEPDDNGEGPSLFDLPVRTELRLGKDASGAAETNAGGDGLDDHPWGEPDMFEQSAVAPAAALAIVFRNDGSGEVLTVSRHEPPYEQAIPGGGVDPGETPDVAAVRELAEECGIAITLLIDADPFMLTSPTDGRLVAVFTAAGYTGEPYAAEPNTKVAWLSPADLLAQSSLYRTSVQQMIDARLFSVIEQKTEATTMKLNKDAQPAGPATEPNGDEPPAVDAGSGGADIVQIAGERLDTIMDAIAASGGLTPDLKQEVGAVVALLETVAPDDDYDMDTDDAGLAAGPGQPMPMIASDDEKKKREETLKARIGKKRVGKVEAKKFASPEAFVAAAFKALRKAAACADPVERKKQFDALQKALTYGTEAFGNESAYQGGGATEPAIPMYTDDWQEVPAEVATPAEATPRGQYAEDPSYTPNANSQQAFDAGTPQMMEKRLSAVTASIRKLTEGRAPGQAPAASSFATAPAKATEPPADEKPEEKEARLAAEKSAVQKALRQDDGWPDDLATNDFMKGEKLVKSMPFGWDDLPSKAAKLDPAGGAVDAR